MSESNKPSMVHCPTCNQLVEWCDASTWKPFCSKRCNLIDLGEWLDEKPRIPGEPVIEEHKEW